MMFQVKNLYIRFLSVITVRILTRHLFLHAVSKLNIHTKTSKHPTCHKRTMQDKLMKYFMETLATI